MIAHATPSTMQRRSYLYLSFYLSNRFLHLVVDIVDGHFNNVYENLLPKFRKVDFRLRQLSQDSRDVT